MSMRAATFICVIVIIGCASLVGRVSKAINHDDDVEPRDVGTQGSLGTSSENLIWFMQVSDLHLSVFHDPGRVQDLLDFCNQTVDIIRPSVVIASGDLTDAKTPDHVGSTQFLEEWKKYKKVLEESNVLHKTTWLDIRGNHDNFNVPSLESLNNYYQNYSVQGRSHRRSYMHVVNKGVNSVAFIGVDACLLPGPKRPFNFVGVLHAHEMEALTAYEVESRKHNHTIWFGHYPTSCILSPDPGIRSLMRGGLAYLCGHLHTLGGVMPHLYTRQKTGSLELELGDWKHNRVFRVLAIDNGLLSFADVSHGTWPIILITNPKHSLYLMPQKEPIHLIRKSSHVRVLVWSMSDVKGVWYRFDSQGPWLPMVREEGPLHVAPWNPAHFSADTHTIQVKAVDARGRQRIVEEPFSVSGHNLNFGFWQRVVLMSNISLVFQFLFGAMVFLCIVPLCVIKWFHHMVLEGRLNKPRCRWRLVRIWFRKLWILAAIDKLFWPLILSSIYVPFGPWFVGEVLDGHVGVAFAWGIFVNSSYLPGSLTYAYGFLQMLFFHLPLAFVAAHFAELRYRLLIEQVPDTPWMRFLRNFFFALLLSSQTLNAYFFYLAYGTMALILGPLRTWAVILGAFTWCLCATLHKSDFRSAALIWSPHAANCAGTSRPKRTVLQEPSEEEELA